MTVSVLVITSKQSGCKKVGSEKQKKVTAYVYIYIFMFIHHTVHSVPFWRVAALFGGATQREINSMHALNCVHSGVFTGVSRDSCAYADIAIFFIRARQGNVLVVHPNTHTHKHTHTNARTHAHTHTHTYMHYIYINPVTSHPYLIPESTSTLL